MLQEYMRTEVEAADLLSRAKHRIGVISPSGVGNYGEIVEGIRRGNRRAPSDAHVMLIIAYNTYDVDSSSITIAVRRAIADNVSVIITTGSTIGRLTKKILEKEAPHIPLICTQVGEPVATGLIPAYNDPGSNLVALNTDKCDVAAAAQFMQQALPGRNTILIPLHFSLKKTPPNAQYWLEQNVTPLITYAEKHSLNLIIEEEEDMHELFSKVERKIKNADVLFVPYGNLFLDHHRGLGALCDEVKRPFFACHDWAVRNSAALGYAMSFMPLGEKAAELAMRIIFNQEKACQIPFEAFPANWHPMINTTIAQAQGLSSESLVKRVADEENLEICEGRIC